MNIKTAVINILLSTVVCGCAGIPVHFADAPIEKLDLSRGREVKAIASGLLLFDIIPIGINDRQVCAYEKLKEEAGNDYLTDIKIQDVWKFVIIGHKYVTILTANAYPEKTSQPLAVTPSQTLSDKLNELKKLRESGNISEIEYEQAKQRLLNNF